MKNLLRYLAFVLMVGGAFAQNNLPACPSSGYLHNCFGTVDFANGNKYVGEWKDNKYNGQGTFTFADGAKYVGEFKDGMRNGQGTDFFANGNKYVGENKADKANGQGTFTFANGNKHVGEYKDGKRNGQGTFTFADGAKYVGEFKDGMRNGQGTLYASNGSIVNEGMWGDDKFLYFISLQQAAKPNIEKEIPHENLKVAKKENTKNEEKPSLNKQNAQLRGSAGFRQMWGL